MTRSPLDDFSGGNDDDDKPDEADDEPAGHSTRFGAGQPSNRTGRPPGAKGRKAIVRKVAAKRRTVTEGGVRRRRSYHEIVVMVIRNLAVKGHPKAARLYDELLGYCNLVDEVPITAVFIFPEKIQDPDEWSARAQRAHAERRQKRAEKAASGS